MTEHEDLKRVERHQKILDVINTMSPVQPIKILILTGDKVQVKFFEDPIWHTIDISEDK